MSFPVLLKVTLVGLAAVYLLWPWSARAQDVTCRKGDAIRRIHVVVENARRGLPCDVVFWSTPTDQRKLWRAEYERGFCAEKLRALVQRLTDDRWLCQPTDHQPAKSKSARPQPVM